MSTLKGIVVGLGVLIGFIALIFVLELVGLGFFKFFEPKKENIRREVFENTQSYVHGKVQDLAKHYGEYQKADADGRETIRGIIVLQFAEFDEKKIKSDNLRRFLVDMRGF